MKKKYFRIFTVIVVSLFISGYLISLESGNPPVVVIVGGGPAGLATAMEAYQSGAKVTIIEKRSTYTRNQLLFLTYETIKLLKKWNVNVPSMEELDFQPNLTMGVVRIRDLEEGLNKAVKAVGIDIVLGEFLGFDSVDKEIIVKTAEKQIAVPYDYLVAADGAHSPVRKAVGINSHCYAIAKGIWTFIQFPERDEGIAISKFITGKNHYIRKITLPFGSIILMQSFIDAATPISKISPEALYQEAIELGWAKEAALIAEGKVVITNDITITFQQVDRFSDEPHAVLIIGDAAATGSFFHGKGVNTAFQTAAIAGRFFRGIRDNHKNVYNDFNSNMKEATDELLNYSRFLSEPVLEPVEGCSNQSEREGLLCGQKSEN